MRLDPIPIGLAGLGRHGRRYARHLLRGDVPEARLVAVHRRDAVAGAAWAAEHGVRFHATLEELAADEGVAALVGVLPPTEHPRLVRLAAERRKPVLVEKPLAATADGAREAVRAAETAGIPAMVAQTLRFDATIASVRAALPALGALRFLMVAQRYHPSGRGWLQDPAQGGLLLNIGVHGADLVHHLTGEPVTDVRALARGPIDRPGESVVALLRTASSGTLAVLHVSSECGGRSGRLELAGERGRIEADYLAGRVERIDAGGSTSSDRPRSIPTVAAALSAFARAVAGRTPVAVPLRDGLAAVELVERIRRAAFEERG